MKNYRSLALLTGVSLLLAACTGTRTPTVTAASVEVTTTAASDADSVNVRLNSTAAFSAVVKAADGSVLTGKTLTWTSSNPDVATVDGNGVVTARRFGSATISATVDGVTGKNSKTLRTYGLEAFAGIRDGGEDTAMLLRYRTATGARPAASRIAFTITGPSGWNGGAVVPLEVANSTYFTESDGSGSHWFELGWTRTGTIPAVIGDYLVNFKVDGEEWTSTARISSLVNSSRTPTNIQVTSYSTTSVTAKWDNVVPGGSYQAEVQYPPVYLKTAGTTFSNLSLTAGTPSYVRVHALTLDTTAKVETALGGQFDVRYGTSGSFTP